ncbi:hypothetical protein [Mechercharimyces sp. CAU 1602]|uniref:hypothetical protein n=1 Tax=Mechercharimyces sp. CAU 1602 TaxID=2973933 RepID=UPI002163601F|nr:hypothetical protein [Mechercharimyces sp. CAU 1602]MCS1351897.1 hypothetical protein [Mechercharimyces sp. CAU 1602]
MSEPDKPIRCIQCYKQRPGGRCNFCPLHKKNRALYHHIGEGWYLPRSSKPTLKKGITQSDEESR